MFPKKYIILSIAILIGSAMATYGLISFFMPQTIVFSYGQKSCVNAFSLLPDSTGQSSSTYKINFEGGLKLGSLRIFASSACAVPITPPAAGKSYLKIGSLPLPYLTRHYEIVTPEPPIVKATSLDVQAVTQPLRFSLSENDSIHDYRLVYKKKYSTCSVSNKTLSCPLSPLEVDQGQTYDYKLERVFNKQSVRSVLSGKAQTLSAVLLKESSLVEGVTLYTKPRNFTFNFNKPISSAIVKLEQKNNNGYSEVESKIIISDSTVSVSVDQDLVREAKFRISLINISGEDTSQLDKPHVINFSTSGAPKVVDVNIGQNKVDPNAAISVKFDQPITAAVASKVKINGAEADVLINKDSVQYKLRNAARCASFSLTIDKGVVGAENNLVSDKGWALSSRINCRTTTTIGYSVQGRPIVAYYYGSGTDTKLITGNIHGNEKSTNQTLQGFIQYMDSNAQNLPTNKQVVVIPSMNPDGYTLNTRNNVHNVNLARNYPTDNWQTDITSATGSISGGGGSKPSSEPETTAVINLVLNLRPNLILSYHSQGSLVGSNSVGGADNLTQEYCNAVGYRNMTGKAEDIMGYTITGEFETWAGEKLGIPAMVVELPSHSGNYFSRHQAIMWSIITR